MNDPGPSSLPGRFEKIYGRVSGQLLKYEKMTQEQSKVENGQDFESTVTSSKTRIRAALQESEEQTLSKYKSFEQIGQWVSVLSTQRSAFETKEEEEGNDKPLGSFILSFKQNASELKSLETDLTNYLRDVVEGTETPLSTRLIKLHDYATEELERRQQVLGQINENICQEEATYKQSSKENMNLLSQMEKSQQQLDSFTGKESFELVQKAKKSKLIESEWKEKKAKMMEEIEITQKDLDTLKNAEKGNATLLKQITRGDDEIQKMQFSFQEQMRLINEEISQTHNTHSSMMSQLQKELEKTKSTLLSKERSMTNNQIRIQKSTSERGINKFKKVSQSSIKSLEKALKKSSSESIESILQVIENDYKESGERIKAVMISQLAELNEIQERNLDNLASQMNRKLQEMKNENSNKTILLETKKARLQQSLIEREIECSAVGSRLSILDGIIKDLLQEVLRTQMKHDQLYKSALSRNEETRMKTKYTEEIVNRLESFVLNAKNITASLREMINYKMQNTKTQLIKPNIKKSSSFTFCFYEPPISNLNLSFNDHIRTKRIKDKSMPSSPHEMNEEIKSRVFSSSVEINQNNTLQIGKDGIYFDEDGNQWIKTQNDEMIKIQSEPQIDDNNVLWIETEKGKFARAGTNTWVHSRNGSKLTESIAVIETDDGETVELMDNAHVDSKGILIIEDDEGIWAKESKKKWVLCEDHSVDSAEPLLVETENGEWRVVGGLRKNKALRREKSTGNIQCIEGEDDFSERNEKSLSQCIRYNVHLTTLGEHNQMDDIPIPFDSEENSQYSSRIDSQQSRYSSVFNSQNNSRRASIHNSPASSVNYNFQESGSEENDTPYVQANYGSQKPLSINEIETESSPFAYSETGDFSFEIEQSSTPRSTKSTKSIISNANASEEMANSSSEIPITPHEPTTTIISSPTIRGSRLSRINQQKITSSMQTHTRKSSSKQIGIPKPKDYGAEYVPTLNSLPLTEVFGNEEDEETDLPIVDTKIKPRKGILINRENCKPHDCKQQGIQILPETKRNIKFMKKKSKGKHLEGSEISKLQQEEELKLKALIETELGIESEPSLVPSMRKRRIAIRKLSKSPSIQESSIPQINKKHCSSKPTHIKTKYSIRRWYGPRTNEYI